MTVSLHETCAEYFRRRLSEGWKCISLEEHNAVLLSPEGIRRELDLRNDIETLRPCAPAGDETSLNGQTPAEDYHWDKVDDVTPDGEATMIWEKRNDSTYYRDLFNLPAHTVGSGSINCIRIYFNCNLGNVDFGSWARPSLKSDSTVTDGEEVFDDQNRDIEYMQQWNVNPANDEPWEWSDIDALQVGVALKRINLTAWPYCTQIYVEVDYTEVAGGLLHPQDYYSLSLILAWTLGVAAALQTISPSAIASLESFGTPTISPGVVGISPPSIASLEAFGTPIIVPGSVVVSPSAIASLEAFGTPAILPGAVIISPSAIASAEVFGAVTIIPRATISPTGIASVEIFGTPTMVWQQFVSLTGIPSAEAFGIPTIIFTIKPTGIISAESFGIVIIMPGAVTILPTAITSLEAFGTPTVILLTRYDLWTDWNVDAYAVALCAHGAAVFAFRIDATDGNLYRCESSDNADNWGSWIDMGDVSGVSNSRLAACFKDADEAIVLYSIGGTLYRRRWNGSTWEAAAAWSNSLSSVTGISVTYMGDWNVVVTGVDGDGRAGVWTCVLGNGYSAAVDSWSALKDVMIAESGSGISFCYPSLAMPDVFRMFFVETYSGSESYSRPYWSHSLATADFISNLWREPIPFNLDSDKGLALCYKSPYAWLSRPDRVLRAPLTPPFVELTDSLLSVSSRIIPYRGGIEITLRNDDRRFNTLGSGDYEAIKKASEILISWGYHTTSGKETGGFDPTTWIESWEHVTRGGQSELILHTVDGWDLLERWRARRQFAWSAGSKNIYQLLALIFARAGLELSAFSTSTALVNQYPAFTINPGESGLTAVKRLLSIVPDVIFFVRDTAYLKNPLAADSSQYAYGTDHVILEGSYRELAQKVNRAQVFGDGVFTEDWDWDEIALVHDRLAQASDINIDSTTKAHQRGAAILRGADIEGIDGHILVPMNCGQDLFDVVSITSPQAGLNASKRRVLSLTRTWTPNKPKSLYSLSVGLGAP